MKEYVFRKGNPIGIQLVDMIAISVASAAQDILQAAAVNIHRDALWASFSTQMPKRAPSKEQLRDLLHTVSSSPLADVDPRLPSVLFDPHNKYSLDWRECCKAMAEDPLFSPHLTFAVDQNNSTQTLFYMAPFDGFLSLSVDNYGALAEALLLWRHQTHENEESTVMAGQAFANYLMHFLWHIPCKNSG